MFSFLVIFSQFYFFQCPILEPKEIINNQFEIDTVSQTIELNLANRENLIPISNAEVAIYSESNGLKILKANNNGVLHFQSITNNDSITVSVFAPQYLSIKSRIPNKPGIWNLYIPNINSRLIKRGNLNTFPSLTKIETLIQSEFPYLREYFNEEMWPGIFFPFPCENMLEEKMTERSRTWPQNSIRILNNPTIKYYYQGYPLENQKQTIIRSLSDHN